MPIEVKMWQARDGATFPTEVEALRHELQREVEDILGWFCDESGSFRLYDVQNYFRTRGQELLKVVQYFQFLQGRLPDTTPKLVIAPQSLAPGSYKGHLETVASGETVFVIDPD
jgi:hypothetical protein